MNSNAAMPIDIPSIAKAISSINAERSRQLELRIALERIVKYWAAFDVLAERFEGAWSMTKKYHQCTMNVNETPVRIIAFTMLLRNRTIRSIRARLQTAIEREARCVAPDDSAERRWLLLSDDAPLRALKTYRRAYEQVSVAPFERIFLRLRSGRVEDLSSNATIEATQGTQP
jgi:hypothetical protein